MALALRREGRKNVRKRLFVCLIMFTVSLGLCTQEWSRRPLAQSSTASTVNYVVVSIFLATLSRSEAFSRSTSSGISPEQFVDFKNTLWWRSVTDLGMPGILFTDVGEPTDAAIRVTRIPATCMTLSTTFSNIHPFDMRWLILDCVWRETLSVYEYIVISDLGDVQFLKNMQNFFDRHADHELFLMLETELDHPFQRDRFEACFRQSHAFRDKLPFNGGFQAGREHAMRRLVRELASLLLKVSAEGNKKCLELSCDQALLTKLVYEKPDEYAPFTLGDLHPPYAKSVCSSMAKHMYHVVHKNQLVDSNDPIRCTRLLADAYYSIGQVHPSSELSTRVTKQRT